MAESKTEKMRKLFADKQVSQEQLDGVAGALGSRRIWTTVS